jgi:CO/xanthine dehydrogenase Mo-binding subunit
VAERFHIEVEQVHVLYEVHTDRSPHDWATAASRSLFMAGRAALEAADDAIHQIKQTASIPLACPPEDLEVAGGRVFLRDNPSVGLSVAEVALGYQYPKGTSIGGQVIGRGRYIARHLTGLDPETGRGEPALEWTLGAEGVEVEVNLRDGSYRVLKAACTMDVGRVVHPALARGQIVGALAMALGFASREGFQFDERERAVNGNLRDFKLFRYGDEPEYLVDFLETPQGDGPYGLRGLGEQGVIGVPAALANALSRAIGVELNELPLTPERVWRALQTRKTQKGVTL